MNSKNVFVTIVSLQIKILHTKKFFLHWSEHCKDKTEFQRVFHLNIYVYNKKKPTISIESAPSWCLFSFHFECKSCIMRQPSIVNGFMHVCVRAKQQRETQSHVVKGEKKKKCWTHNVRVFFRYTEWELNNQLSSTTRRKKGA